MDLDRPGIGTDCFEKADLDLNGAVASAGRKTAVGGAPGRRVEQGTKPATVDHAGRVVDRLIRDGTKDRFSIAHGDEPEAHELGNRRRRKPAIDDALQI